MIFNREKERQINIFIYNKITNAITELAKENDRSMSSQIRVILNEFANNPYSLVGTTDGEPLFLETVYNEKKINFKLPLELYDKITSIAKNGTVTNTPIDTSVLIRLILFSYLKKLNKI